MTSLPGIRCLFSTALVAITIAACSHKRTPEHKEDAIRLAEEFVKRNGYTKAEADKNNFEFEVSDNLIEQDIPATLEKRYNTLHPEAFCILNHDWGWQVGFLHSGVDVSSLDSLELKSDLPGRMVYVYLSGEVRMSQNVPLFSGFVKLK